ncbi:MAG TPA: hypothetical protein HA254_06770 [Candidatus Diapherotrites archaeon]|uniref:Uncharacterized protein n=1 Tax=Candidatus Iainarchaeum sp. TaxID=3101447 RepID=A0A7J4J2N7_9ARCH|nr:hypothetical protein [Candidatus Diapherotrites archaeon]
MPIEEIFASAPGPVRAAIKTVGTIALPFVWGAYKIYPSVVSFLPEPTSVKLLGKKSAISNTKGTGLAELVVGQADLSYSLVTGDNFLPGQLTQACLLIDGFLRYTRASAAIQELKGNFSYFKAKKPAARGTLPLELPYDAMHLFGYLRQHIAPKSRHKG